MAYTSIFASSAPSQPTTLPGGGYTSIFTPQAHVAAVNKTMAVAKTHEKLQLSKDLQAGKINRNQFLTKFAQQQNEPIKVTAGQTAKNIGAGIADTVHGLAQFTARAPIALGETGKEVITGKPQQTPAKKSGIGQFIFGNTPIQGANAAGKGTQATHPGGFHIKGTPITLSPKQAGAAEAGLSTGANLLALLGTAEGGVKAIDRMKSKVTPVKTQAGTPAKTEARYAHYTTPEAATNIKNNGFSISKTKAAQGDGIYLFNGDKPDGLNMGAGNTRLNVKLHPDTKLLDLNAEDYKGPSAISGNKLKRYALDNGYDGATDKSQTVIYKSEKITTDSTPTEKPNVAQSKSAPITPHGQEGAVAPGQAISDVKAMLQKHQESTKFSGELEKNTAQAEGSKKVIQEDAAKLIEGRQELSNTDKQTLQDFRDAKAAGLTPKTLPEHLIAEDQATTELNKATQAHDAELARLNGQEAKAQSIEGRNPETYTHREAMDKGTALDYVSQGSRKNPLSVSGFSKTTPASKARVFHAVTDEAGNRRVVAIKNSVLKDEQGRKIAQGKLVQAIDNGTSENLGKLKFNTNQDFLDKELSPYKTKINNLQKEYNALSKVKTKGGVSQARMEGLAKKGALLEDVRNFSGLTKAEAKSLRDATLKFQELSRVKDPSTNATGRLKTLNRHLIDLNNKVNDIHAKYDPENLDKKIFVGKDGKQYTVGQATASEITKATGQKYYTDPKLMAVKNYAESRTALENARFIDSIKTHPDFEKFASEPGQTAPKGWKPVKGLMQFPGYKFEPKTAEVLTDIVKNSGGDEKKLLDSVGNVLKQTIVYFPLKHSINEGATYAVDRGLSALANPMAYKRGAQSLVEAFHEVSNQGPKFQAAQKAGLHTVTGGGKALEDAFAKEIKNLAGNQRTIEDVAKQWGSTPARIYSAVQNVTVWQLQDILNMARVIERTKPKLLGKGMSLEDAVAKTQRYNLQYSVPSRVGPRILPGRARRSLANTLASPRIFFGRYRYDLYRILSNTIKDTVNLKSLAKGGKENAQALDKLAALALGAGIVWPLVDKGIQKISGDKNAYMKAPGALELPAEAKDVVEGKKKASGVASNQLFISSAVTVPLDIKSNRDSFTGKQIYDPNASGKDQLKAVLNWSKGQVAPAQSYAQVKGAGGNKVIDTLLTLASARFPKNSPETNNLNSLKYDSLPNIQKNAKDLAANGNIDGAINAIKEYDAQVLEATKTALKSANQAVPDDKTLIIKLKDQGYYYNPTRATVQGWASPSAKPGTLDAILSATPAPKKGQPGYLQYRTQQKQKSFMSKFKKPADKQLVIP